ncbi:MAG: ribosome maturation factor RimM [Bacilli bacterium]
MKYIYVGKIVNTHGIKGEVRILSDFKYKDLIFKKDISLYIGNDKIKEVISSHRVHKNFDLVMLKEYNNINDILKYKGLDIYIDSEDLKINNEKITSYDLIGYKVFMNNKCIGVVDNIIETKANDVLVVLDDNKKRILIPNVKEIVNIQNGKILVSDIKGLIE